MKKIIIAGIALIILVGGYVLLNTSDTAPTTNNTSAPEVAVSPRPVLHTVNYTDAGFTENELVINAGDSVMFTNNATHELMAAFGEHATHDEYPDNKVHPMLSAGMSDTITFPDAGTFDYHNHHAEDDAGTIIVK